VGIVEEVGKKGKKAFTNLDELWETLNFSSLPRREGRIQKGAPERKAIKPQRR